MYILVIGSLKLQFCFIKKDMSGATTKGLEGICLEVFCENGGTCELIGESDIDFQCRCSLGWTGEYCTDGES